MRLCPHTAQNFAVSSTWRWPHSTQNGAGRSSAGAGGGVGDDVGATAALPLTPAAPSTGSGEVAADAAAVSCGIVVGVCGGGGDLIELTSLPFLALTAFSLAVVEAVSALGDLRAVSVVSFALTRRSVRRTPEAAGVVLALGLATSRRVETPVQCSGARETAGLSDTLVDREAGADTSATPTRVSARLRTAPVEVAAVVVCAPARAAGDGGEEGDAAAVVVVPGCASDAMLMMGLRACDSVVGDVAAAADTAAFGASSAEGPSNANAGAAAIGFGVVVSVGEASRVVVEAFAAPVAAGRR